MTMSLTADQEAVLLADLTSSRDATYNVVAAYRLRGTVDISVLRDRFATVVRRHPMLATRVEVKDDTHVLVPVPPPVLAVVDIHPALDDAAVGRRREIEAGRSFVLARGPLFRGVLLRRAVDDADLVLVAHHVVVDEPSLELLAESMLLGRDVDAPVFADWVEAVKPAPPGEGPPSPADGAAVVDIAWGLGDARRDLSAGGRVPFSVPAASWAAAVEVARRAGVTPPSLLVAAAGLALARNSRTTSVPVAVSASRRPVSFLSTVGYFNRTVLTDVRDAGSVPEFLTAVQDGLFRAYRRSGADGHSLGAVAPLVVVSCTPLPTVEAKGFTACPYPDIDLGTAQFPLGLYVYPGDDGSPKGFLQFQLRAVAPDVAAVFARQVTAVLAGIGASGTSPLADVGSLDYDDAVQVIARSSGASLPQATDTIVSRVLRQAARLPDAVALLDDDGDVTYGELVRRSETLARALCSRGVRPGDRVGVSLRRGGGLVIALLAVLRAGAAYVPLDPDYPAERLELIVADAAPVAIVALADEPVPAAPGVAVVDSAAKPPAVEVALPTVAPTDAAYIIYTSGSSGVPKGVVVEHRNVVALLDAVQVEFPLGSTDVWSLFHSFAFDFSVWECWGCLMTGGRLVPVPFWTARDPREFRRLLAERSVTILSQTPSAFAQLVGEERSAPDRLKVRLLLFGGESLDSRLVLPWLDRYPCCMTANMYGITETTVHCTWGPIDRAGVLGGVRSAGRPLSGWGVYVLDPYGRVVPQGVLGELHVAGAGVAREYLRRPGLTTERFVEHAVLGRLYRSGDVGRYRLDGGLEVVGRLDDQVKVAGHRIELGEIRSALLTHDQVEAAAAMAVLLPDGGASRLEAYVVGTLGGTEATVLHQHLRARLPAYMLPAIIHVVPELPLTPNGKLDTARLADRAAAGPAAAPRLPRVSSSATTVGAESAMLTAWRTVLGIPVGPDDNFFEAGGNSLLALRLQHALRDQGFRGFGIIDIFKNATPRRLGQALAWRQGADR